MVLSTTMRLLQVDQGPNNIRRGIPCRTAKTWMIFLPESTNDLYLIINPIFLVINLYHCFASVLHKHGWIFILLRFSLSFLCYLIRTCVHHVVTRMFLYFLCAVLNMLHPFICLMIYMLLPYFYHMFTLLIPCCSSMDIFYLN